MLIFDKVYVHIQKMSKQNTLQLHLQRNVLVININAIQDKLKALKNNSDSSAAFNRLIEHCQEDLDCKINVLEGQI